MAALTRDSRREPGVVVRGNLVVDVVTPVVCVPVTSVRPAHQCAVQRVHIRLLAGHHEGAARGRLVRAGAGDENNT